MNLNQIPIYIILLGFLILIAGVALEFTSIPSQASVGGVIFIGPFPIVFGSGQNYQYLIAISLFIAVSMLVLSFMLYRRAS
jgi:uncharacterized membrane protein